MRLYVRFAAVLTAFAIAAVALVLSGAAQSRTASAAPAVEVGGVALAALPAAD